MAPGHLLGMFLLTWLSAVAALLAYRVLTGAISLDGLFTSDGARFSPERLQLLIMFLSAIVVYAASAMRSKGMPDVPEELLIFLGGSNAIYLAGKIARGS